MDSKTYVIREGDTTRKQMLASFILGLSAKEPVEIVIRLYKKKRSSEQNRLYWQYMTDLGRQVGQSKENMHAYFSRRFLPSIDIDGMGLQIMVPMSTTKLKVKEFQDYLTQIEVCAFENGYTLSSPH